METQINPFRVQPAASVPQQRGRPAAAAVPQPYLPARLVESAFVVLLLMALPCSIALSASVGAVHVPLRDLVQALLLIHPLTPTQHTILFAIRLPRILASALVGAALAVSGLLFQGLFRNPLADPYIIGASGGAALGACIGIVFLSQLTLFGFSATALLAFAGAVLTMIVVYMLARTRGRTSGVTLLLAGFAVGTLLSNSTYLFEVFDPNLVYDQPVVLAWLHGSVGTPEWGQLGLTSLLFALGLVCSIPLTRRLNTLALGNEYAGQLGMRVEPTRIALILVASFFTAIAVALGGLISFAGLIVPHIVRLIMGPDHARMLPATVLLGGVFLVVTDTLARTLFAPSEVPVGILIVCVGCPFFLYLLRKSRQEYTL